MAKTRLSDLTAEVAAELVNDLMGFNAENAIQAEFEKQIVDEMTIKLGDKVAISTPTRSGIVVTHGVVVYLSANAPHHRPSRGEAISDVRGWLHYPEQTAFATQSQQRGDSMASCIDGIVVRADKGKPVYRTPYMRRVSKAEG